MPKRKKIFEISKINKRKAGLPVGRLHKIKRFINSYSFGRRMALLFIVIVGMWLVYNLQGPGGAIFKASVLEATKPFSGTVYPVDRVPDWTHWGGDNHTDHYSSINPNLLAALPEYDLSKMQFSNDDLQWGNSSHDLIRNTKITYSVLYLGTYQGDHKEGIGSHAAVDIRMPVGTPLKSIANGRIVKVKLQNTGFGNHVVIEHKNVPDPDRPGKTTTLYSSYSHMGDVYVKEGQSVDKGERIGLSGNTGTSTTPHLHFQIDKASAPWHPYWAFSWSESQAAGLSFFEAVNAGLGISNAREHTVHPLEFVEAHLNYNSSQEPSLNGSADEPDEDVQVIEVDLNSNSSSSDASSDSEPAVEEEVEVEEEAPINILAVDTSLFEYEITGERISKINNGVTLTALLDRDDLDRMSYDDEVNVTISGEGRLSKKRFKKVDFKNSAIKLVVNSSEPGEAIVSVGKSSYKVSFIDEIKTLAKFSIESDGNYQSNQVEVIQIVALDDDNNPTPVVNFGGTIEVKAVEGSADFKPDRLAVNDFKNGVAEVKMTSVGPDRIRVRVQNGALIGESDPISIEEDRLFTDVSRAHPNYDAIKALEAQGIVSGYSDGRFQPEKTVNRVEALKMLMLAFDIEAGPNEALPFTDTDESAWYATALSTALRKDIVKGYEDGTFRPSNTVNKAEYLKMLFETNGLKPTDDLKANPYEDVPVNAWYAGYAYLTNQKNLLEVNNNRLNAGSGMTRGDVAESIYRLQVVLNEGLLTYAN